MLKGGTFSHVYLLSWPEKGGQVEGNFSSLKNFNLQIEQLLCKRDLNIVWNVINKVNETLIHNLISLIKWLWLG